MNNLSKLENVVVSSSLRILSLAVFLSWIASEVKRVIEPWLGN